MSLLYKYIHFFAPLVAFMTSPFLIVSSRQNCGYAILLIMDYLALRGMFSRTLSQTWFAWSVIFMMLFV